LYRIGVDSNLNNKAAKKKDSELAISLLNCETEKEVELVLREAELLNESFWRPLGDSPTNYSIAGNQQASPVASLVEKLVNSLDAVLIDECRRQGIDPRSGQAPKNMRKAIERFYNIPEGRLENVSSKRRGELAQKIHLIATGRKDKDPCYTIVDMGEGQTPSMIPQTILSLPGKAEANKAKINFVQGLFNMGGTGVLRFCGRYSYCQLVISRSNPFLNKDVSNEKDSLWGFTIVRRKNPAEQRESSVFEYLAPNGKILSFRSESIPAIPGDYPNKYEKPLSWGTCIKLYEYEMSPKSLASHAVLDLNYELSRYFQEMALPIRVSERRETGREKEFARSHSYEGNLAGMAVRQEEKKEDLLEEGYPADIYMNIEQIGRIPVRIYAFGTKVEKETLNRYVKDKAIIFTINGQMHAFLTKKFLNRKEINLSILQNHLMLVVDCSSINPRARECLFMASRDRLAEGEIRDEIERNLVECLSEHEGLQCLAEKRRDEALREQLQDNKPLKNVLQKLIKTSPSIANLFSKGLEIVKETGFKYRRTEGKYFGRRYPTFFRLKGGESEHYCPINSYCVISYETDAANDYFTRGRDRGQFRISNRASTEMVKGYHLWNGILKLSIKQS